MVRKLNIDKAGRVVIPKSLRDRLRVTTGDALEVEGDDDRITLRPVRPGARLIKTAGIWVYHAEPPDESIPELIDRQREARNKQVNE